MSRVRRSRHVDDASIAVDDKCLIVIVVLAILFGASRLPSLARNLGEGIREFKRGIAEDARDDDADRDGG
jgi:TatA/E family protein of Tat protein translocase